MPEPADPHFKPGYHTRPIQKGVLGEVSKIVEEAMEVDDAAAQGVKLMVLAELSDLVGAIKAFLTKHHPDLTLDDLDAMSHVTERAFKNGRR